MSLTDGPSRPAESRESGGTRWVEGPTAPDRKHSYARLWLILLALSVVLVGGFFAIERLSQVRERTVVTVVSTDGIVSTPTRNIVVRGDRPPIARTGNAPAGVLTVRNDDGTHSMHVEVEEYSEVKVGQEVEVCAIRHRLLGFTEIINSPDC